MDKSDKTSNQMEREVMWRPEDSATCQ